MFQPRILCVGLTGLILGCLAWADETPRTPRQALQPFNGLIGSWHGTGTPTGTKQEQAKFWTETVQCQWQFKGDDAWIQLDFDKGKYYLDGTLRYVPAKNHFELALRTLAKEAKTFTGTLEKNILTVECTQGERTDRLVINMLHSNRILYRQELHTTGAPGFTRLYQVGATREGVPFAEGDGHPECIVSGGQGTISMDYKGQTYWFCCRGCQAEFRADPEKYIREVQQKKKSK